MSEATVKTLPPRKSVNETDTWDLSSLYATTQDWETDYTLAEEKLEAYAAFQGRLGESAETLAELLAFDSEMDLLLERLGYYAFLRLTEDQANSDSQALEARMQNLGARAAQAGSWIRPELLAIDSASMDAFLDTECLQHYQLKLQRILRYRPHTLGEKEEQLLAMQAEMAQASSKTFRQLHDADLKFGEVENDKGELVELGNATFSQFLISPDRNVRKTAFHQYYDRFQAHENTLAATLGGSIQKDVYYARARQHDSALAGALFPDNVPKSVYDNLIASVRNNFEPLYKYYELRRRLMDIDEIHHYDTYVPIISDLQVNRTWDQATDLVMESLTPLGSEYCEILEAGLRDVGVIAIPTPANKAVRLVRAAILAIPTF